MRSHVSCSLATMCYQRCLDISVHTYAFICSSFFFACERLVIRILSCIQDTHERSHSNMCIRIYDLILTWMFCYVTHFQISAIACFLFACNYVLSVMLGHIGAYVYLAMCVCVSAWCVLVYVYVIV